MQTVVETPTYLSAAEKLFSEEERADIVLTVAADPECGEVMKGTGGFRKFRVARGGKGKSGGARVLLDPDFAKLLVERRIQGKDAPWIAPALDPDLITVLIGEHP